MIQVIDDVIPNSLANEIESKIISRNFPWFYTESASGVGNNYDKTDKLLKDSPQHIHVLFDESGPVSNYFDLFKTILFFIEEKTDIKILNLFRIKVNLLLPNGSTAINYNPPHIDYPDSDYLSIVYYVNDCDGSTVIFDKTVTEGFENLSVVERIEPKKGRCVIFPSNRFHCSSNPVDHKFRSIINFCVRISK